MFISPIKAIEQKWIVFPEYMSDQQRTKCMQPNALDVTMDKAFTLNNSSHMILSESVKQMRTVQELNPIDGYWNISQNQIIDVMSDFFVAVPKGVAAMLISRSTLVRNGLFFTSGLYDQGFENYIGGVLHNFGPNAKIAPHTRIAQIAFIKSEDTGLVYQGDYNKSKGTHWATAVK